MYLPPELPKAKVLITVKTYPNPSRTYTELVCNAGLLESGEWIRIYPIQFRALPYEQQYKKYNWIELDLVKNTSDFRRESYRPKLGIDETIIPRGSVGTGKNRDWAERRNVVLREVFTSMTELITLAKTPQIWKSLATVKPKELIRFEIVDDDPDWDPKYQRSLQQLNLFNTGQFGSTHREPEIVRKVPYRYYYHFVTEGDSTPRRMMIEDWEIGALYWNTLAATEGDEIAANEKIREKYEREFFERDIYLFVGTTLAHHIQAPNPFMIIGVFYPPKTPQMSLPLGL